MTADTYIDSVVKSANDYAQYIGQLRQQIEDSNFDAEVIKSSFIELASKSQYGKLGGESLGRWLASNIK